MLPKKKKKIVIPETVVEIVMRLCVQNRGREMDQHWVFGGI